MRVNSNSTHILHHWIGLGVVSMGCVVTDREDWCLKLHNWSRDAKVTNVQSRDDVVLRSLFIVGASRMGLYIERVKIYILGALGCNTRT